MVLQPHIYFRFFFTILVTKIWSPWSPRISNFQHASLLWLYQPNNLLINKKMRFGRFKVWFGTKASGIRNFGNLNFTIGHWNMSSSAHISSTGKAKNIQEPVFHKTINLTNYYGRKLSFKIFAPTMSSIWRPRIYILDFLQFYLIKLISFIKYNVLVSDSTICAWNMRLYRHI